MDGAAKLVDSCLKGTIFKLFHRVFHSLRSLLVELPCR